MGITSLDLVAASEA
jgi:hypothetical protein